MGNATMRSFWLMALLCLMSSLPPLAIDMGLPAMGAIQTGLGGTARDQELMLSVFMAGFALTPLAYGALSDRYGRKPAIYIGMVLFSLAGVVCALAPSIGILLVGRFFAGSGAGAGVSLAFAIVRDLFEGPKLGGRLAVLAMVVNVAPMVAPSMGALMLGFTGWRGIFAVLAAVGGIVLLLVVVFLPETGRRHPAAAGGGSPLGEAVRALGRDPSALGYVAVYGLSFGSMFAYIASSSLLIIGFFHASPYRFALLFALNAAGIVGGAYISGRLGRMFSGRAIAAAGLAMSLAGPGWIALLLALHRADLSLTMVGLLVATFGNGLANPAATKGALSHFPQIAGLVGALLTTIQMSCAALASGVAALFLPDWGIVAVPAVMLLFAAAALGILVFATTSTADT